MVDEADRSSIDLLIGEAKLEMGKELTEYFMTEDPSLVYDDEDGVDLKIIFKRRLSNEVTWVLKSSVYPPFMCCVELIPGPDDLSALLPDDLHQLRHLLLPPPQLFQHSHHSSVKLTST